MVETKSNACILYNSVLFHFSEHLFSYFYFLRVFLICFALDAVPLALIF